MWRDFFRLRNWCLVNCPVATSFLVVVQDVLRRGDDCQMYIFDAANFFGEVAKVVFLRESSKLLHVVQSNVHEALDVSLLQSREKGVGRFLCEADCKDPHAVAFRVEGPQYSRYPA
jgi:hypothetical protein